MPPNITHPCNTWAVSAGHANWTSALESMKAGVLLCGHMPIGSKSLVGLKMLMDQVDADGLHFYADESGRIMLGTKASFPQTILDAQERAARRIVSGLQAIRAERSSPRG